jgi:hypothetical protein
MSQRFHDVNVTNKLHNEDMAEKLSRIEASLTAFYSYLEHSNIKSKSIKINRMKSLFLNVKWLFDKNKRYVAIKNMYWSLPEWLRLKLDGHRHRYVQKNYLAMYQILTYIKMSRQKNALYVSQIGYWRLKKVLNY